MMVWTVLVLTQQVVMSLLSKLMTLQVLENVYRQVIFGYNGSKSLSHFDFYYTPSNNFEIVFRSNLTDGACVNISQLRVFYCNPGYIAIRDPKSTLITCNQCPIDEYLTEDGVCVSCPYHSTSSGNGDCICDSGYVRTNPDNTSLPCDQCAIGYFMNVNGLCSLCPLPGYDNVGSSNDVCRCYNATPNGTCQFCAANYIRNGSGDCVLCPPGSTRKLDLIQGPNLLDPEDLCMCMEGSLTESGEAITRVEECNNCTESLFWNGTQCSQCPINSERSASDNTTCVCRPGTLTLAGSNTTATEECICMSGHYHIPGIEECQICPDNSFRTLSDLEVICPCLEGFRRDRFDAGMLPCLVYAGFNVSFLQLQEGDSEMAQVISIFLSQTGVETSVMVSASTSYDYLEFRPSNLTFLAETSKQNTMLIYMGNTRALEEDVIFNITLLPSKMGKVLTGGPNYFGYLSVIISDDDILDIGFTSNWLVYNQSRQVGIDINISTTIGRTLVAFIRANDSFSPNHPISLLYELVFTPDDPTSIFFNFNATRNHPSTRYIQVDLELAQSVNSARDKVTLGELPGLYRRSVLVLEGNPTLSDSSSIQVAVASVVGGSILVLLLLIVLVSCVLSLYCHCHQTKKVEKRHREIELKAANAVFGEMDENKEQL